MAVSGDVAAHVDEQRRAAGAEDAAHLRQGFYRLGEVFEGGAADDEVDASVGDGQRGGVA